MSQGGNKLEYSREEFEKQYQLIRASVLKDSIPQEKRCVVFLGGQPGAGKSTFVDQDDNCYSYWVGNRVFAFIY